LVRKETMVCLRVWHAYKMKRGKHGFNYYFKTINKGIKVLNFFKSLLQSNAFLKIRFLKFQIILVDTVHFIVKFSTKSHMVVFYILKNLKIWISAYIIL